MWVDVVYLQLEQYLDPNSFKLHSFFISHNFGEKIWLQN